MSVFGQAAQQPATGGGLFGNTNATQQSTNNLFGSGANNNAAQAQTTPTINLFGAPQQQSQNPGSLFGGGNAAAQATTPNLFGSPRPTTAQPASSASGLFGGLGGGAQPAAATNSKGLFGSALSNPAPAQQTTGGGFGGLGGGLFGAGNTSLQPAKTGLFGATANTQQQATAPLFGASAPMNNASLADQSQAQPQNGVQSGPMGGSTNGAYFNHLIERGKKRQGPDSGIAQFDDLPSLQLGLGDIASKVRNLGGGLSRSAGRGDSRAHYLLAASGVPRGSTLRDLNEFTQLADAPAPSAPQVPVETDIEAYVANLRAKSTMDLINESLEQSKRDFDAFLEESVQLNMDLQRKRIYEHFGLAKPDEDTSAGFGESQGPGAQAGFGRSSRRNQGFGASSKNPAQMSFGGSTLSRSVLGGAVNRGVSQTNLFSDVADSGTVSAVSDDPFTRTKQEKYSAKVRDLNAHRLQEVVYPVIEHFANVEMESSNDPIGHLVDGFKALKEITKENSQVFRPSDPGAIKERQYTANYLDNTPNSGKSIAMRKQIVEGSRKFLEQSFYQGVEDFIAKNPREANVGGVPSKINKVRAYVRIRAARKDLGSDNYELQMLNDDYCWALIYYLLRCGLFSEAAQYVSENERAIKSMDRNFAQYISSYVKDPERRLPRTLQTKINAEFQQRSRLAPDNSIDPYRMACYKIVGRCDLAKKHIEGVPLNLEDWMWLLFSLAREVSRQEETASEVFTLEDAQVMVEDIGQRHFSDSNENVGAYATLFLLLVLVGRFERAVASLYAHNYVTAVHFAIALDYYGLLRVSDFSVGDSELLTYTTKQQPQISFGRLIGYYTRDFRMARAESAVDYLALICLNSDLPGSAGQSQTSVCHEALKELVLETREFAMLLGDVRSDGQRIEGAIEQRLKLIGLKGHDDFLRTLTIQAAAVADDSGRTSDAVLLYHLAEEYDSVTVIVNRALSDAVAVELGQDGMRLQPLKPRQAQPQQGQQQNQQQPQDSLSLTSVDNPVELARNMITLYNGKQAWYSKIRETNRVACGILIRMAEAKDRVEEGRWSEALDLINSTELLPIHAKSNVSVIRSFAQKLNSLQPVVARNIGNLLMWTITCCSKQRELLQNAAYQMNKQAIDDLSTAAKDLMMFAGLIRYKLPPDVFEVLARAGQNVGGY